MADTDLTKLRALIQDGLRWLLTRRGRKADRFALRDAGVSGRGVRSGLSEGNWDEMRAAIYKQRGS